jgi:hypothetical protein
LIFIGQQKIFFKKMSSKINYNEIASFFINYQRNFQWSLTNIQFVFFFYLSFLTTIFLMGVFVCWQLKKFSNLPDVEEISLEDLQKYNQVDNYYRKIYISIRGRIFDVTGIFLNLFIRYII